MDFKEGTRKIRFLKEFRNGSGTLVAKKGEELLRENRQAYHLVTQRIAEYVDEEEPKKDVCERCNKKPCECIPEYNNHEGELFGEEDEDLFNEEEDEEDEEEEEETEQEEPKRSPQPQEENLDYVKIEGMLHPAGGILQDIVYEPVGNKKYLWIKKGEKGLSPANFHTQEIKKKDEKGKEKIVNKINRWLIKIGGLWYQFKGRPLDFVLWRVPNDKQIAAWGLGQYQVKTGKDLYKTIKKYFEIFGDYEEGWHPTILAIDAFQKALKELSIVAPKMDITGKFGGGKTTVLEIACDICPHGCLAASISSAGMARIAERFKLNLFVDDLDQYEEALQIAKSSYRKGASKYMRWNMKTGREDISETYGSQTYSYHFDIDDAMKSRSLAHLTITRSKDHKLPVINLARENYAQIIAVDLFFWTVETLANSACDGNDDNDDKNTISEETAKKIREEIYENMTKDLSKKERILLKLLSGRDCELAYTVIRISKHVGDIEELLLKDLVEAINLKKKQEEEGTDIRKEVFREELLKERKFVDESKDEKVTKKGIRLKPIMASTNQILKEEKKLEKGIGTKTVAKYLREFGFRTGRTKIKDRDGIYLIFDDKVEEEMKEELSKEITYDDLCFLSNTLNAETSDLPSLLALLSQREKEGET